MYRLNPRQRREIDQLSQKLHFNFAPPPGSLDEITTCAKFVSLTDFIERSEWEYSDLDIVDRREIKVLAMEDFWEFIAKTEVPLQEPGHLSPITVAKVIVLGVHLVGVFIEGALKNRALFSGADFPARVIEWALGELDVTRENVPEEINFRLHFQKLTTHPVINAGVRLASWHLYRLPPSN
jgi:hypothetical protein